MIRSFQMFGMLGLALLVGLVTFVVPDFLPSHKELVYEKVAPRETSAVVATSSATTSIPIEKTAPAPVVAKPKSAKPAAKPEAAEPQNTASESDIYRITDPYSFPQKSGEELNQVARAALVNILCQVSSGSLRPISGSGVLIDPRGVILTNAHVAQYVLLSSAPETGISCVGQKTTPAKVLGKANILYMPKAWVAEHAKDIKQSRPLGTGENDYALLMLSSLDDSPLPSAFPYLSPDSRDAIGFTGDTALLAAYPAEFAGGVATQNNLYASSAFTKIGQLLTFGDKTVDLISLGGVILAQGGSSGGAVVNGWGRLIGIISTTSDGATTGERDLRAITLSYVNRDLMNTTGSNLSTYLAYNPSAKAESFMANEAPGLVQLILDQVR